MKKDYLSATRFSKAVYCGLLGYHLSNEDSNIPSFVFQRGRDLHDAIDQVLQEGQDIQEAIPEHFKPFIPKSEDIIPNAQETKYAEHNGKKLKCIGTPDLRTKDTITEFKSGKYSEWHKWQTAFYKWLFDTPHGRILYFDIPDLVIELTETESEFKVTDELIIQTWNNVLLKKPNRCSLCTSCPIKKQCPEWKGTATEDMLDLIDTINAKNQAEERKRQIVEQLIDPLNTEILKLKEKESFLREKITKELPKENVYEVAGARIQVSYRKTKVLPEGFVEPSYEEEPELYKKPVINETALIKKFGIETSKPVVTVKIDQ